jgi:hypothetical protein
MGVAQITNNGAAKQGLENYTEFSQVPVFWEKRGGSQKCEEFKVFFPFFSYAYFLHIIYIRNHTINLKN